MACLSCPYVKPQLSATTLNIFSVISCPAPFTSSLPSLCLCDYLWTFSKHYIFLLPGYLNQLLLFPLPNFKLILTSPKLWSFHVFCCRLLTLWDITEILKCYLPQGSQTPTPLTLPPRPWGGGHKLPGEKGQEAWANPLLLECPPHRWSAGERLLPTFFWQEGTASIMAFESKRHFLLQLCCWHFCAWLGFHDIQLLLPGAPSHFPSIWQEKISKVK